MYIPQCPDLTHTSPGCGLLTVGRAFNDADVQEREYLPVRQKPTRPEQSKEFGPVAPHTYGFPSADFARDTASPDT